MTVAREKDASSLQAWEQIYAGSRHLSVWPWTDVVSLTMRLARPKSGARVLELGCGAGANIPFFQSLGVEYWGIEGSESIVARLHEAYPDLAARIVTGDFSKDFRVPGEFDLIVDRGSITHNPTASIRGIAGMVRQRLAPGGRFLGVDWFSTKFSEYRSGKAGADDYTRVDFVDGRLAGTGLAHFCDEAHLRDLLSDFEFVFLEHKTQEQLVPEGGATYAAWNFVACAR